MPGHQSVDPIIIYCDGACSNNQSSNNVGGWGVVLKYKQHIKELHGGERNTSNQRMELTACIRALEEIKSKDKPIIIHSDSAYLVNCMHERWYERWQRNGWKNVKKQPVENRDLWEQLLELLSRFDVTFQKVQGHAGVELNERADVLAREGIRKTPT
ncbi:MAG: ribonuclease HI [Ignavibacteriae bacterium]|nr:ribonuclease HI [Ignavibacteriota bacterium]